MPPPSGPRSADPRLWSSLFAATGAAAAALLLLADPVQARAAAIAGACLALWLGEAVPPFVPTLLLLAAVPLLLPGAAYAPRAVLVWAVDPVLALFFGGFALAAAARRQALDAELAAACLRLSRGRPWALVALVLIGTAALSMWMSNIAAAALMLAALGPVLAGLAPASPSRRALLLALALGADFGGIATPIGSGPNAIALAALGDHLDFLHWMALALPLVVLLLAGSFALIALRFDLRREPGLAAAPPRAPFGPRRRVLLALLASAIALWLGEPLHGLPAPVIALALAALLFASGLLERDDLAAIDWSTLLLIAGGLALGRLLEQSGLLAGVARLAASAESPTALALVLVGASALLSAVMSNTATASMLIPLALTIAPGHPELTLLVAIGASLGVPFAISTPPNAMAVGAGLKASDLLWPGLALMAVGCVAVATTGPAVARWFGVGG